MMQRTVYLESYDLYEEILAYEVPDGRFRILTRSEFARSGAEIGFGRFTREGDRVAGVFATSAGPVFFLNGRHVTGKFEATKASVEALPGGWWEFRLRHRTGEEETAWSIRYKERIGIGANPYDNEQTDVDLVAVMALGTLSAAFFRAYTRE